jgi:hypothetical protein
MNTPAIAIIIAVALIGGSALAIIGKVSKGSYENWCAPISLRHHYSAGCLTTIADLRYRGDLHSPI